MSRILMLSWEYPPLLVGGLGRHVHALAGALTEAGHEVTVVTRHCSGTLREETIEGVRVVRAPEDPPVFETTGGDLLAWATAFNHALTRAALRAVRSARARGRRYDVVHAHDWLVAHAAMTVRDQLDAPLVATVHATESGRHQGWLPDAHNRTIHDIERWLCAEADRVIVCSEYMRGEVIRLFGVPPERTRVVRNGVDALRWRARPRAVAAARARFAGVDGPLVSYAGRLVYEKGVQHLLAAVPALRDRFPGLRVVIAGDGPYREELELRSGPPVTFAGFLTGHELTGLMAASDCYVVPSIYEPFGMVALEAAAAGTPVAVSATGGLTEIIEHGRTGVRFPPGDPAALTDAVAAVLSDREYARSLALRARARVVEDYNWHSIATRTAAVYDSVRARPGLLPHQTSPPLLTIPRVLVG
ncbi:glycosyltransferase family 4 protein [Actinoplanes siamensis]|uniref:Glycogen synthase n=1 Tax=Actinoplanes siamensis TaxID=1223317 RepID=A0A919N3A6_9ACTN|nr:glycosyltransferase family 4 protein [Actinoplanes siamensis]GIF03602.1 glycogen synthase [Actinoplanes siamensis]